MKIYSKDGSVLAEVGKFQYQGTFMGESFLSFDVDSAEPINFEIGDYVTYRDERYELNYTPAKLKNSSPGSIGDAFKYKGLKFNSLADELTRCDFLDFVLNENQVHFSNLPNFSFYAQSVQELADRLQANLNRVYTGDKQWTITVEPSFVSTEQNVVINNIKCWEALRLVNSLFKGNFVIRGRNITIGTAGLAVEKIFGYGKDKGLFMIEQQTNNDTLIITRLRAYGSTRNIPDKYYNNLKNADGKPLIPESQYVKNLMLPSFAENGGDAYIDSPDIDKLGVREGTVFFDGSDSSLPDIYPSLEGMTAEELKAAGFQTESTGELDVIVTAEQIKDNGEPPIEGQGEIQSTFWVNIKDIGFDINDHLTTETAQISMKTGMCAGRAFDITKCKKIAGGYRLTLKRDEDSGLGLYFPYDRYNIKTGDKFVLLNIEMPGVYIKTAEQKLLKYAKEYLSNNDKSKYTYVPKIDNVFMARNPQFHDTLKEGDIFNFNDTDLWIDASVIIQSLIIKEGGIVPEYEITLFNDKIVSGSIEKIQNAITSLANNVGITATEAKGIFRAMIDAWYPNWFNQKLHTTDDVQFKNALLKNFQTDNFAAGPLGAGSGTIDQNELQTDKLLVRKTMYVLEMMVQKMRFQGGVYVLSPANGFKISKVEDYDTHYRLFFETGSGQVKNEFIVGDQGRIQNFGNNTKYLWSLVIAVGDDYIDLSKTDKDGDGIPEAGDEVVQLGNRTDTDRQDAVLLSAVNGEVGLITYFGINSFDLSGKEGSWIGKHGGKKGAVIRGELYFTSGENVKSSVSAANDKADSAAGKANDAYALSETLNNSVNNIITSLIPDLQEQIDGSIMSWDGNEAPSLNNYPASQWTTDEEKKRHIGDYYDYFINQDGKKLTERYKFAKQDGIYQWVRVADSESALALSEAREALGIAGSKSSITFGTRPMPPYSIDDLWIDSQKNIRICRVQRENGATGLEADWELVNDTQVRLSNMASDSVISKEEKPSFRNTLSQIQKEYDSYNAIATNVNKSALTTAYNNVASYLTGTLMINDNVDTYISEAQRNQLNSYMAIWYSSVTEFTNLLSEEEANKAIANVRPGTVNYVNGSRMDNTDDWYVDGGTVEVVNDEKFGRVVEYSRPQGGGNFQKAFTLPKEELADTDIVYYVIAKRISETGGWAYGGWIETFTHLGENTPTVIDLGNGWRQYWTTFKSGSTIGDGEFGLNSIYGTWRFYAVGVLKGNKPASWSPSLPDQQSQIDAAKDSAENANKNIEVVKKTVADLSADSESIKLSVKSVSENVEQAKIEAKNYTDSKTTNTKPIDLSGPEFDQNKYYPVTFSIPVDLKSTITVSSKLWDGDIPEWSEHKSGFTLLCKWTSNGSWGAIKVDRTITDFIYNFSKVIPCGSIGQMDHSNNEYIYLRGGGAYKITTDNNVVPILHTEPFTVEGQTVDILDEVTEPEVTSATKTELRSEIKVVDNRITSEVGKITETIDGINTEISGVVTESNFVDIFSKKEDSLGRSIVSSINVSPGNVLIDSEKIVISGKTKFIDGNNNEVKIFGDGNNVLTINGGVFNVDKYGELTSNKARIKGEITATSGNIGGFRIENNQLKGERLTLAGVSLQYNDNTNGDLFASFGGYSSKTLGITSTYMIYAINNLDSVPNSLYHNVAYFGRKNNSVSICGDSFTLRATGNIELGTQGNTTRLRGNVYMPNVTAAPRSMRHMVIDTDTGRIYHD